MHVRNFCENDVEPVITLAKKLNMFDKAGLSVLRLSMNNASQPNSIEQWFVAVEPEGDDRITGVVYAAPEQMTNGTWNMLMLLVDQESQHKGVGHSLVNSLQCKLRKLNCRVLIVDTSGLPEYANARKFYEKLGFEYQATIPDYFDSGDDKLTYIKYL